MNKLRIDQRERWQRGDHVSVETYVRRHPELERDVDSLADLVLGEIQLREAAGEQVKIDAYLVRFPHCRERLLARYRADLVTALPDAPAATLAAEPAPFAATLQLDEQGQIEAQQRAFEAGTPKIPGYKILSELGRGGMGVVYRARQLSADRDVALKLVRNDVLDTLPLATRTSTLTRFQHEAHAAAKLQHDNIVAVYDVGESGGLRFYAMRFVDGVSLYDMLRDKPLENRRAARYIEQVARGLHFAHQQGVLHRDLKPHNVIIEKSTDRPLLTDFGLAKFLERREELTHDGAVMGTPSYMSPEQARDSGKVTALADVYSLGATLYHLLTSRPPFQAANVGETIRQVLDDEPVPPRTLNPAIDHDLETICLKCIQKDPSRRYASAEAFADDLRRYLEGHPILARPVSRQERLIRWCRRNPKLAGAIGTAVVLGVIAIATSTWGYLSASAALVKEIESRKEELAVIDDMVIRLSEDDLRDQPGLQSVRKDVLGRALKHYQRLLERSENDPSVQDAVAAAHYRIGLISLETGDNDTARKELTRALDQQQRLLDEQPENAARAEAVGDTLNYLGRAYAVRGLREEGTQSFRKAEELRAQLADRDPKNVSWQRKLATVRMNLGLLEFDSGNLEEGRSHIRQAQERRSVLLSDDPNNKEVRRDLAIGYFNLAAKESRLYFEIEPPRPPEKAALATSNLRQAIEQFRQLDQSELANLYRLAVAYRQLGGLLIEIGQLEEAVKGYDSALPLATRLAVGNPDVVAYQIELADLHMNQGALYDRQFDELRAGKKPYEEALDKAIAAWSKAADAWRSLLAQENRNSDYRRALVESLAALAEDQAMAKDTPSQIKSLEALVVELSGMLIDSPEDQGLIDWRQEVQSQLQELLKNKN